MPVSAVLTRLDPAFRPLAERLLDACRAVGVEMRPYSGLRCVREQARLWRQSRTRAEIDATVRDLRRAGCPYLADTIEAVGPQRGARVTNALPGHSWHNWGMAVDCFLVGPDGRAIWDAAADGYRTYAVLARSLDLTAAYWWRGSLRETVHVQMPNGSVLADFTPQKIDRTMKERFG